MPSRARKRFRTAQTSRSAFHFYFIGGRETRAPCQHQHEIVSLEPLPHTIVRQPHIERAPRRIPSPDSPHQPLGAPAWHPTRLGPAAGCCWGCSCPQPGRETLTLPGPQHPSSVTPFSTVRGPHSPNFRDPTRGHAITAGGGYPLSRRCCPSTLQCHLLSFLPWPPPPPEGAADPTVQYDPTRNAWVSASAAQFRCLCFSWAHRRQCVIFFSKAGFRWGL